MKFKKLAAAFLAGAMIFTVTACGGGDTAKNVQSTQQAGGEKKAHEELQEAGVLQPNTEFDNTQTTDETIVVGLSSEPSSLWHPAKEGTMGTNEEQIINGVLLDRLVQIDPKTKEVAPMLATAWEWVDGTHLKFTLRDDVKMMSGQPFTSADVVYSVNTWMKNCATNDTGKYLVGAVADDEHTVTIEYNAKAPDILKMMSWANFGIVSEADVNAAGGLEAVATNPLVGTGKYKFKEWKQGEYILLERNDNYWDKNFKGYYKEVKLTFTADPAARAMAVQSGDAQVAVDMPVSQASTYAGNAELRTYIFGYGQQTHLWYNMGENAGPTKDLKVRQAIDKALNFDAIAQVGTAGYGSAALSYVDPAVSYFKANYTAEERAQDIEGAKALLAEAGFADGIELTAIGLQDNNDVLTVMQSNLAEAGIKLNISISDTGSFVKAALFDKAYDLICVGDDLTYRTPQFNQFFTGGMVIGGPATELPELVAAGTAIMEEADESKLAEEVAVLDKLIKDQTICSNLYSELKATIADKDVKGYAVRERGYVDLSAFYK